MAKKSDLDEVITMSRVELRELMVETVEETLVRYGVDIADPMKMQANNQWTTAMRESTEAIKRRGILTIVGTAVLGTLAAIAYSFSHKS